MPRSGVAHCVGTRWTSATRVPISELFITPSKESRGEAKDQARVCGTRAAVVQKSCSRHARLAKDEDRRIDLEDKHFTVL